MKWVKAGAVAIALWPCFAAAQEDELPDKFALKLGTFYVWDSDTEFSARRGSGALGTSINFDRDLGGDQTATQARLRGYYRFTPHHRIDFGWYRIKRSGTKIIEREIQFGNVSFPISATLSSEVKTEIAKIAYTWSFYHNDDVELGLSVGANVASYDFTLENATGTIREAKSVSAPLPVFGLRMDYTIDPRWHLLFDFETFYIEFDNQWRGSLDDLQFGVEYRPFRHVSFGVAANRLAVDAKLEDSDFRGSVSDLYRGAQVYVGLQF